jgi:hypothetical protein
VTTVAEALAPLWKGDESWAYWVWRFPAVRERLGSVHPWVNEFPWNAPRLRLDRDTKTVRYIVRELSKSLPIASGEQWWMHLYLGAKPPLVPFIQQAKQKAAAKAQFALLAQQEFPAHYEINDWPRYAARIVASTGWSEYTVDKLWPIYRVQERERFEQSVAHFKELELSPEAHEELAWWGSDSRLLSQAKQATTREQFAALLEEAHLARRVQILPQLYALAWKLKSSKAFPGMPSGWEEAWQKAAKLELEPSKDEIKSWLTDIVRAISKDRVARIPIFNLEQARAHWFVRYRADWWHGDSWPQGYPSLKTQIGDGASEQRDIRKPLLQQNLDELQPEFGDYFFAFGFSIVLGIMSAGLAELLVGKLFAGAGIAADSTLAEAATQGLSNTLQAGVSDAAGLGGADLGDAFLEGASSVLANNPMGLFDGFDLGGFGQNLADIADDIGQVAGGIGQIAGAIDQIGDAFDGGKDKSKGKPAPPPPPPTAPMPPASAAIGASSIVTALLIVVGVGVALKFSKAA